MIGDVRVRRARLEDAPMVARILQDSYPRAWAEAYEPALLAVALPIVTRPNRRLLASRRYYLVEASGDPIGCGGWSTEMPGFRKVVAGVAHLRHFAVGTDWAGRGIGRLIYSACVAAAHKQGVRHMHVYSSLTAEPFYAAMGFRRIGRIEVPLTGGVLFPSIHMRQIL